MSLARDFFNYYGNCYVGFQSAPGAQIVPFYVTNIRTGRNTNENDYSEDAVNKLRFSGYTIEGENRTEDRNDVTLNTGKLILEMPELGYVRIGNRAYWLSFRPQRSTRKGLCDRRVDGLAGRRFDDSVARQIYLEAADKPEPLRRHFIVQDGELHYKGYRIGRVRDGGYDLFVPFRHLSQFVRKAFGEEIVVDLVEEEQNA